MTPRRLIIADHGLRNALGHHLSYSMAVAEAARARGIAPLLLTHAAFTAPLPDWLACRPSFDTGYRTAGGGGRARALVFGAAALLPGPLAACVAPAMRALRRAMRRPHADSFAIELTAALAGIGAGDADLVLLHSVSAANLASLLSQQVAGILAVVLRRTPAEMDRDDPGPVPVGRLLRGLATRMGSRLRLFADTAPLVAMWREALDLPVAEVPPPVMVVAAREGPPADPPHLVFAGGARAEKGYAMLPALVQALAGRARFSIHSGPVGPAEDPVVQRAHAALRGLDGVTLLERALPFEDYLGLLREADLLLLPYDAASYGPRSSSILAEARALGVPAVVSAGWWAADTLDHDMALVFHNEAGFIRTVQAALARLPDLLAAGAAAAPGWRAWHSPATLLDRLLCAPASGGSRAAAIGCGVRQERSAACGFGTAKTSEV
jgi:glycosyltransferase involved in cell wall biosynthesis